MGKLYCRDFGRHNPKPREKELPRGREYRIKHLEAMAREEKKYNKEFGTHDVRYQNLLKKARKPKRRRESYSFFDFN